MKKIRKIICSVIGHSMFSLYKLQNERSAWGRHKCTRCEHEEYWQYDFG